MLRRSFHVMQLLPRERKKHEYLEAVKNRYKHLPEVKRIVRYVRDTLEIGYLPLIVLLLVSFIKAQSKTGF